MRKRILIGFLVLAVAGTCGYVLSQPKKGSVEWHKKQYKRAAGTPGKWIGVAPGFVRETWLKRRADNLRFHREALVESGYLTRREFTVSNVSPAAYSGVGQVVRWLVRNGDDFLWAVWTDTNVVTVTAPAAAMKKAGELIQAADVP